MNISLVIVTHDLDNVLILKKKNLEDLFDEIIIVYTNNPDKKYNPRSNKFKLYFHKFNNYFPEVKNYALSKVHTEWIFTLDTDEDMDEKSLIEVATLKPESKLDGYWLRRKIYIKENKFLKYGVFYPDYQMRLFKNKPMYKFNGGVHASLPIPNEKTQQLQIEILHYSTIPKYSSFRDFLNFIPYIKMDALEFLGKEYSVLKYFFIGLQQFCAIFFGGFFRGKGFLDGWDGFRAHLIFATSIACSYWLAGYWKLIGKK